MAIINQTHQTFVEFQRLCRDERLPSAQLIAEKVGTDLKTMKQFATAHEMGEFYSLSLFRCSVEAARLLIEGQISHERAVQCLKENGHDSQEIAKFKEIVMSKKK